MLSDPCGLLHIAGCCDRCLQWRTTTTCCWHAYFPHSSMSVGHAASGYKTRSAQAAYGGPAGAGWRGAGSVAQGPCNARIISAQQNRRDITEWDRNGKTANKPNDQSRGRSMTTTNCWMYFWSPSCVLLCCAYVDIHIYNLLLYLSLCVYTSKYIYSWRDREREGDKNKCYVYKDICYWWYGPDSNTHKYYVYQCTYRIETR